jgi:FAD/FMN-containing dehydrogenase
MSASLGGTVATTPGAYLRYGPTRDWVRGIRVMLANGGFGSAPGKYFVPSGEFTVTDTAGKDYR